MKISFLRSVSIGVTVSVYLTAYSQSQKVITISPHSDGLYAYIEKWPSDRSVSAKFLINIENVIMKLHTVRISPNNKRIAYWADGWNSRGNYKNYNLVVYEEVTLVSGKTDYRKRVETYDEFKSLPVFSPNSKRLAYIAKEGSQWFVVIDGTESVRYSNTTDLIGEPIFSLDSQHLAYTAQTSYPYIAYVVVDGVKGESFEDVSGFAFAPNSSRWAYRARKNNQSFVVTDSTKSKAYNAVLSLLFSPDSKRLAYVVEKQSGEQCVVLDGIEGKPYQEITKGTLIFSPNSKKIAYAARSINEGFVIVDSTVQKGYIYIKESSLVFSPDSKHLAYVAGSTSSWPKQQLVVIDGRESGEGYYEIQGVTFSPNSERVAYAARDQHWFVVVDEQKQSAYEYIYGNSIVFSPDSKRIAYFASTGGTYGYTQKDRIFVVLDGDEGPHYSFVFEIVGDPIYYTGRYNFNILSILGTRIVFGTNNSFHYLAMSGKSIYLIEEFIN